MRARSILFVLVILLLLLAAYLYLRGGSPLLGRRQQAPEIPLDLLTVIPEGWQVLADQQYPCNYDDDPEQERLLIYHYNRTTLSLPFGEDDASVDSWPVGGIVYDTQAGTFQEYEDNPGPYRASNLVPYKLLPDYYGNKGQGYLGDARVRVELGDTAADEAGGEGCRAREITVYGFGDGPLPTRISIFRWASIQEGFKGWHSAGNARIEWTTAASGQVNGITTYNRLLNHRSLLCEVEAYTRPNTGVVDFIPDASVRTIDFCFGAPGEPVYPEAAVVALLRNHNPSSGNQPNRYLLDNAIVPPELAWLRDENRRAVNIVRVGNPASAQPYSPRSAPCTQEEIAAAAEGTLWCGRERVRVETRIVLDNVVRDVVWILISVVPNTPRGDLYWRVAQVELL